ncbi:MAG: M67 family metallopeptidase [Pleurocapsa minor GSE-CHR-MK-17-07R]|jgi:proteasome lid subunit RPN8/RPN11|nr:M67 family metallopeptidase [Pleurocapsa minor GSE-CHR-MK 17-07R]
MNVTLSHSLQEEIVSQMQDCFPNEGGGFLLGEIDDDNITIREIVQIENSFEAEEQYHRYAMTPQNWVKMEDTAEEKGLTLVGYYHSHPSSPAIPSKYDRDHALPNFIYIITAVYTGPKCLEQRVWRLREDRSQFDEEELIVEHD